MSTLFLVSLCLLAVVVVGVVVVVKLLFGCARESFIFLVTSLLLLVGLGDGLDLLLLFSDGLLVVELFSLLNGFDLVEDNDNVAEEADVVNFLAVLLTVLLLDDFSFIFELLLFSLLSLVSRS